MPRDRGLATARNHTRFNLFGALDWRAVSIRPREHSVEAKGGEARNDAPLDCGIEGLDSHLRREHAERCVGWVERLPTFEAAQSR